VRQQTPKRPFFSLFDERGAPPILSPYNKLENLDLHGLTKIDTMDINHLEKPLLL
jgi:hypothetical protein